MAKEDNAKGLICVIKDRCKGCGICELLCPDFAIFVARDVPRIKIARPLSKDVCSF